MFPSPLLCLSFSKSYLKRNISDLSLSWHGWVWRGEGSEPWTVTGHDRQASQSFGRQGQGFGELGCWSMVWSWWGAEGHGR